MVASDSKPEDLGGGIWSWATRHPDWHPGEFGAEVRSYALRSGRDTVLVDPLVPAGQSGDFLEHLDRIVRGSLVIAITLGYHVRSAADLAERYQRSRKVQIIGPKAAGPRLPAEAPFRLISPGEKLPQGITAHRIGSPVRGELPMLFPSVRAIAFGDAIVEHGGSLRLWDAHEQTEKRRRWNMERLVPTLEPLLELSFDRVLVTHGQPVLSKGRDELAAALRAGPWYHRG